MASVSSDQAEISYAESTTNWTGDTFSLEPDIKVQGSNSVSCAQTNNGNNDLYYAGSWDLSSTHIRLYWNISYVGDLSTTNPVQVFLSDGTNTDYVTYFSSNADYSGGWVDMVLDTALFTTVTLTSITQVGIRVVTASKPRNVPANAWLDNWRYSNNLVITSTTTESVSFTDAAAADASSVYGILKTVDGVVFAFGEVVLGGSGSENANIVSSNEVIVFGDREVTSSLYKLKTQQGTGNTDIDIDGLVCKTVGGTGAEIDISSSLNSLSLKNSSFIESGTITLTPTVTSPVMDVVTFTNSGATTLGFEATSCTWNTCGLITLSGSGKLTDCIVNSSTASSAVSCDTLADLDGCTFVSDGTGHAVNLGTISATTSMTWNCSDSGYASTDGSTGNETILVSVASGQTLTINVASGASIPTVYNTGSGSVSVVSGQVTLTITVKDINTGSVIQGARVYVTADAGGSLTDGTVIIDGVLTDVNGQVSDTRSYSSDQPITGRVRKASTSTYYKTGPIAGTVDNGSGLNLTVQMIPDE